VEVDTLGLGEGARCRAEITAMLEDRVHPEG
jgi:hypothetical protein